MYHKKFSVFLLVLALLIAGTGLEANAQDPPPFDLDIKSFRVTKRVSLTRVKPIKIILGVKNTGSSDENRSATITGVQDGEDLVYSETRQVSDDVGGGSTKWEFSTYTPLYMGDIVWTAVIYDDDPDVDAAVAVTKVVP